MSVACKVVLIGESGVGKSSIISRYTKDSFLTSLASTTGACFSSKTITIGNNKEINFEIWDTAGQERYRSLTKVFYKSANVCLLVYDITRKDSYDEIKDYWIDEIKENASQEVILAIIGNKSDLYEYEQVSKKEAMNYANEIGAFFKLTSAKNNVGIDEIFQFIGEKLVNPDMENEGSLTKEEMENIQKYKLKKESKEKEKRKKMCC